MFMHGGIAILPGTILDHLVPVRRNLNAQSWNLKSNTSTRYSDRMQKQRQGEILDLISE